MNLEFESYFLALSLGILHAFEPGHGKTAIAMFSISQNIRIKHIITLISGVFISHSLMLIGVAVLLNTVLKGVNEELLYGLIALIGSGILFYIGYNLFPRPNQHRDQCTCAFHQSTPALNQNKLYSFTKMNSKLPSINIPVQSTIYEEKKTIRLASWIGISGGLIPCPTAIASFLASNARGDLVGGITSVILFSLGIVFALFGIVMFSKFLGVRYIEKFELTSNNRHRLQIAAALLVILAGFYSLFSFALKYVHSENYRIFL